MLTETSNLYFRARGVRPLIAVLPAHQTVKPHKSQSALVVLLLIFGSAGVLHAADATYWHPSMLVGSDAGLMLEVAAPKKAWENFQQTELYQRWKQTSLAELAQQSQPLQQLREWDAKTAELTGTPLMQQLSELSANGLVLAAYLPAEGEPQGILIARASSAEAVERFMQTLEKHDPEIKFETHEHRGDKYLSRLTSSGKQTRLYYVAHRELFALSDREPRIQQVLDLRRAMLQQPKSPSAELPRLTELKAYRQAANTPDEPFPSARLVLIAAPWQRVWQESASKDAFAAWLNKIWPAVFAITVDLRTQDGLHLVGRVHLDPEKTGERWQAWIASTTNPQEFLTHVPANAVLAAGGGIHFQPLMETLGDIASDSDREGFKRGRKLLRGFLGGKDLFNDILPALTYDIGMYVVPRENASGWPFDGVVQFRFPPQVEGKELVVALDQALSSGLTLLSAQANEKNDDDEPATVHSDVADGKILRWLQSSLPIEVAYRLTPEGLTVSRTPAALRALDAEKPADPASSALQAAREKWFAEARQVLIVDVRKLRELSPPAGDDARSERQLELLSLGDIAYLATQMDAKRLTIRLGMSSSERGASAP